MDTWRIGPTLYITVAMIISLFLELDSWSEEEADILLRAQKRMKYWLGSPIILTFFQMKTQETWRSGYGRKH